jgi:transcriptional regulator with AAA-type ATPase domain
MAAVREQFRIPPQDFAVLLLGEDGTVKLRAANPVSADRLNELIDSMPTRKQEMLRPHAN